MKDFWNERYALPEYVYGKEPNEFFRQEIDKLPAGHLLLPAEGEGRNAVYAAAKGWQVTAFDYSEEARKKAIDLALEKGVNINYKVADFQSVSLAEDHFDALAVIFAHVPDWQVVYPRLLSYLKPGGTLILEIFNKKQMNNSSGGPKNPAMLLNADEVNNVFGTMSKLTVWEEETELLESEYHWGKADVTRCVAIK
jgi:2-polyprenyl-3-methyl-5-hydroxy-6-metoxy-1,4-benzoquinol methylase